MIFNQHTFKHGIHPDDNKSETATSAIHQFPFAPLLMIPLQQNIGAAPECIVREGQEVQRGQLLAQAKEYFSVSLHAPASGVIKHIGLMFDIKGQQVPGIYLQPFAASTQEIIEGEPCLFTTSAEKILTAIQQAGIVGLGGAAFPSHVKLKPPKDKPIDTLVINGVECEPYLTTDHRVMLEQADDIMTGIRYLLKVTSAQQVVIGIEANKQDAAIHLKKHIPADLPVSVNVLPVKYPQGAEKMLIQSLLNRQLAPGKHANDVGVVGVNIATAAEIGRLLPHGRGIQERVVTITGPAMTRKGNYRIPIGTPLRFILETLGTSNNLNKVFMGGPMMGSAVASLDISVTKGTSGIIAFSDSKTSLNKTIYPCIHCGKCLEVCPMLLNPSQLGLLAKKQRYEEMQTNYHLMDCFECGACAYVCPSHIPLVQHFRVAKHAIKKQKQAR